MSEKSKKCLAEENAFLMKAMKEAKDSLVLSKAVDQSDDIMIPLEILEDALDFVEVGE